MQWDADRAAEEERQREQDERTARIVREVLKRELAAPVQRVEPQALIDVHEAARLLDISATALRKRVSDGRIPSHCIRRTGRRRQFIRSALVQWAERGVRS